MTEAPTMIVTGSSRGIGACIARQAAAVGYKVCVNFAASADRAGALVAEIKKSGGEAIAVRANVRNPEEVADLYNAAEKAFGYVNVLVNNAGISTLSRLAEMPPKTIQAIVETNLLGTMLCTQQAVKAMSTKRGGYGGVILNISSIAAVHGGMPGDAIYAGTKGGLDSFTLGMAKEVAREGIRVCGVRPGIIRTEIWDGELDARSIEELGQSAVPMGRIGEVSEIADAVLWLCSDKASYVSGAILNVSGGREIFVSS